MKCFPFKGLFISGEKFSPLILKKYWESSVQFRKILPKLHYGISSGTVATKKL